LGANSFPHTLTGRSGKLFCSKEGPPLRWSTMGPREANMGRGMGKGMECISGMMIYLMENA